MRTGGKRRAGQDEEIQSDKGETERERQKAWGTMRGREKGRNGEKEAELRVCKGEIIKKARKQRRRGVPVAKMAVPLAEAGAFN